MSSIISIHSRVKNYVISYLFYDVYQGFIKWVLIHSQQTNMGVYSSVGWVCVFGLGLGLYLDQVLRFRPCGSTLSKNYY
jgi:hypothetical protein